MRTHTVLNISFASLAIMLAAGISLTASAATVISTFNTDTEGWSAAGDFATPVTWTATGGNPGGTVSIEDSVTGGVTFFVAPGKFLGNHADAYGKTLTFDLKQIIGSPNQFDDDDVFITGAGTTLAYDTPYNPAVDGSWTSYSVPLSQTGWHVGGISGAAATQAQMQSVLASITDLRIRAEYQSGADTDYLDNVHLNGTLAGDFNVDGHVNAADISIAEQALTNTSNYRSTYGLTDPTLFNSVVDVNGDGSFTNADLQKLLINLKAGGGSANSVPEPSAFALLAVGGFVAWAAKWRLAFYCQ
jgi:hypothetical protein